MTEQTPKPIEIQEYFRGFPEAPACDTIKWYDEDGFDHLTTIRAWSGTILMNEVGKVIETIKANGGKSSVVRPQQVGQPKASPTTVPASVPAPAPTPSAEGLYTIEVAKIDITPLPEDKVELKLYGPDRKFPDLYHKTTVAQAVVALQGADIHLEDADFRVAKTLMVECYVDYRHSTKLNSKNQPYKNVQGYRSSPF